MIRSNHNVINYIGKKPVIMITFTITVWLLLLFYKKINIKLG